MKNKDLERSVEGAQKIVKVLNDRTRLKILFFLSKEMSLNYSHWSKDHTQQHRIIFLS